MMGHLLPLDTGNCVIRFRVQMLTQIPLRPQRSYFLPVSNALGLTFCTRSSPQAIP